MRPVRTLLSALLCTLLAAPAAALDLQGLDPATKACNDLYGHANGGWLRRFALPEGRRSWGVIEQLGAQAVEQQRALLDRAANQPQDALDQRLGNFWAAALDEAAMDSAGLAPLQPLLDAVARARKPRDFATVLADAHGRGLPLLFRLEVRPAQDAPGTHLLYALQGGLSLPDRDYYLRGDPDALALRERYRAYLVALLEGSGRDADTAAREAALALEVETRLANASLSLLQLRDPANAWRPTAVGALHKQFPSMQWKALIKAQRGARIERVSLAQVSYFNAVETLLAPAQAEPLRAYLRTQLLHLAAPHGPRTLREAHAGLFDRIIDGKPAQRERWRVALDAVNAGLGPALGQRYADTHLTPATRAAAAAMIDALRAAQSAAVGRASWLQPATREAAQARLAALRVALGAPDTAPPLPPELRRDAHLGNVLTLIAHAHHEALRWLRDGRTPPPPPRRPQVPNLYYDPAQNLLVVSAALLQPPLFDPAADAASNYGALGSWIAHELSHAVDRVGASYAPDGSLATWWTASDLAGYDGRLLRLAGQYSGYAGQGAVKLDGARLAPEAFADQTALEIAWLALPAADRAAPPRDALKPAQRFLLSWAQSWRRAYRDDELLLRLGTDVRAPARWRVNGPAANAPLLGEAYGCKPGTGLLLAPARQVPIWN